MQKVWTLFQELSAQFGWHILTIVLTLCVVYFKELSVVWGLVGSLRRIRQQRRLAEDLSPFYEKHEIQDALRYYVETQCQNIPPSKEHEPRATHAFALKKPIIPFFLKQALRSDGAGAEKYYLVLGDSGMGKTTFLLNLYRRYLHQFRGRQYDIKLFPLAWPKLDEVVAEIPKDKQKNTILLLDAFDEDPKALNRHRDRLEELVQNTVMFPVVVLTCRTQFFSSEDEEPRETGMRLYGPNGGDRVFRKMYISPFSDKDVKSYLNKRFPWTQRQKRRKARQIVEQCPNLMVRPMLLSHIEDLLKQDRPYTAPFMIYAGLIQSWVEREARKCRREPEKRKLYEHKLFRFSRALAVDMYEQRSRRGGLYIPHAELTPFADDHGIELKKIELQSKSLLNRTAAGEYKFSHKSILEYFLAEQAFANAAFRRNFDFEGMDLARDFLREMIREKLVPFLRQALGSYCLAEGPYQDLRGLSETRLSALLTELSDIRLVGCDWTRAEDLLLCDALPKLKTRPFMIYAGLIQSWVEREARKCRREPEKRKLYEHKLFRFSRALAVDMYEQRSRRGGLYIPHAELTPFADDHGIELKKIELQSKSLLNRTAAGEYKFSHKSILEYFLAEQAFANAAFRRNFDFEGMDLARDFLREMIRDRLTLPFFFSGDELSGAFRLNGGQWTTLDLLRQDMLAELTQLRLDECSADRDWLFLMGLTALKILELPVSAFSERDRVTAQLVPSMFPAILRIRLRSAAQSVLTEEFKRIFELDSARRPLAYIHNQYERQDDVVLDRATGLIWQQSGSSRLSYAQAVDYVEGLNAANWGGFADWRLPTVPELLSLLGPKRSLSGLYIASIFEARQVWCWSADRVAASSGSAWRVDFALGGVRWSGFRSYGYVRCVRS